MSYNRQGGTKLVYRDRCKLKGDASMKHAFHILVKGNSRCGDASPFYLICKKRIPTDYAPRDSPYTNTQCAYSHAYVKVCVPTDRCGPGARSTT
jgi:hypothetical protein